MRYSKFIGRSLREVPKEAEALSHRLLLKAGYIDPLMAGVYTFLPLGWRVVRTIAEVLRVGMEGVGEGGGKGRDRRTGDFDAHTPEKGAVAGIRTLGWSGGNRSASIQIQGPPGP